MNGGPQDSTQSTGSIDVEVIHKDGTVEQITPVQKFTSWLKGLFSK